MAKKKSKPMQATKKKPVRSGEPIHVWVDEDVAKAFQSYLDNARPSPSKTAAVETALEEFLASRGFWPPKDQPPDAD